MRLPDTLKRISTLLRCLLRNKKQGISALAVVDVGQACSAIIRYLSNVGRDTPINRENSIFEICFPM